MGMVVIANTNILKPVLVIYVGTGQWAGRTNRDGLFLISAHDGSVWLRTIWRKIKPFTMASGGFCSSGCVQ